MVILKYLQGFILKKIILILLFTFISFSFIGCADKTNNISDPVNEESTTKSEVFDPLSGYNEVMTQFNDKFYLYVLSPTARGYAYIVPEAARTGIDNFFTNLLFPIRFVNNLLQFKFQNSSEELGRFLVNTIFGLGGFMDPATKELNMKIHPEDFGQTLGFYGMGEGFPVVLPFIGQSNLRDMVGLTADSAVSPLSTTASNTLEYKIPDDTIQSVAIGIFYGINNISLKANEYENLTKDVPNLYPFLRDIYSKTRQQQIKE